MSAADPFALLKSLQGEQRAAIKNWMDQHGFCDDDMTMPLLRLLAGAAEVTDEGVRRVLVALLEQERR